MAVQALIPEAQPFAALQTAMSEDILLAAEYRKHAKALRASAKFDREAKTSMILKRIAEDYEQMAKALEASRPAPAQMDQDLNKMR